MPRMVTSRMDPLALRDQAVNSVATEEIHWRPDKENRQACMEMGPLAQLPTRGG